VNLDKKQKQNDTFYSGLHAVYLCFFIINHNTQKDCGRLSVIKIYTNGALFMIFIHTNAIS